jgi:hypothetical protein
MAPNVEAQGREASCASPGAPGWAPLNIPVTHGYHVVFTASIRCPGEIVGSVSTIASLKPACRWDEAALPDGPRADIGRRSRVIFLSARAA